MPDLEKSYQQQQSVLGRALAIFDERNKIHRDLWTEFGVDDALHHCGHKFARARSLSDRFAAPAAAFDVEEFEQLIDALTDSLLDLINYAAMAIRHVERLKP